MPGGGRADRIARFSRKFLLWIACPQIFLAAQDFGLRDGDTVVFYGDSITDRGLYTNFAEAYVVTRFPQLHVRFVNSGWGGDTVSGGAGGTIDVRLRRDVAAYQPTVVTVMLGMNDGRYRPFDQNVYHDFASGYEKVIKTLKEALPKVRITVLQPSPYDDVTRPPKFEGGYNGVLTRFGQFVSELAHKENLTLADLNTGVVQTLAKAYARDPVTAQQFIPDRVHPEEAASVLMAEGLLKSWNAPAIVTEVEIDAESLTARRAFHTEVRSIERKGDTLSWIQSDTALPAPVDWRDPAVGLAIYASDFVTALDDQPLRVKNLKPGDYALKIDGQTVATFPADQFERGINLAAQQTPMLRQALGVFDLTVQHNLLHLVRSRMVQVPLEKLGLPHYDATMSDLDALDAETAGQQRAAAQPKPHRYELVLR